ncbi:hypothetical protein M408DRAFT_64878 [Serendipita vermifera MAFF 305830]|uniref:Uncharacterized protein n=1 Tax=Serendipita vermifera MAFF 305830 TaxID=933852 RepID=A0A0C2WZ14_SERVB|nr:hypothetical protein M408DRAFT_64878 [Serendipita vermifera MAFF 305830]
MVHWIRALKVSKAGTDRFRFVAFSPDGTHIVSSSDDNTIRIWDVKASETAMGQLGGHADLAKSISCINVYSVFHESSRTKGGMDVGPELRAFLLGVPYHPSWIMPAEKHIGFGRQRYTA